MPHGAVFSEGCHHLPQNTMAIRPPSSTIMIRGRLSTAQAEESCNSAAQRRVGLRKIWAIATGRDLARARDALESGVFALAAKMNVR
jgi:hypothetical protein